MLKKKWSDALSGKAAEYRFAMECAERGFVIHFPCSEMIPYDFIVGNGKSLKRVQVKSTQKKHKKGYYQIHASGKAGKYKSTDFDFYALYLADEGSWYIIPIDAIKGWTVTIGIKGQMIEYKQAWDLLK